jgi:hypothetical protein
MGALQNTCVARVAELNALVYPQDGAYRGGWKPQNLSIRVSRFCNRKSPANTELYQFPLVLGHHSDCSHVQRLPGQLDSGGPGLHRSRHEVLTTNRGLTYNFVPRIEFGPDAPGC